MPAGPTVIVDGKNCQLHYFTGKVLSSTKQKETKVSSMTSGQGVNRQTHVSSRTVDHHEFFLGDSEGNEESFKLTDFDFPCREGQTLSAIWIIPEGKDGGPIFHVRNHNTNERHQISPKQIADNFRKPWWMVWGSMAATWLVIGWLVDPIIGMFCILIPFFYFRWRSRKAAKEMMAGPDVAQLDSGFSQAKPLAA
jgi:hypothetical protein